MLLAGCKIASDTASMRFPVRLRDQDRGRLADHLTLDDAEHLLGSGAKREDPRLVVDQDDRVGHGVEDGPEPGLGCLKRLFEGGFPCAVAQHAAIAFYRAGRITHCSERHLDLRGTGTGASTGDDPAHRSGGSGCAGEVVLRQSGISILGIVEVCDRSPEGIGAFPSGQALGNRIPPFHAASAIQQKKRMRLVALAQEHEPHRQSLDPVSRRRRLFGAEPMEFSPVGRSCFKQHDPCARDRQAEYFLDRRVGLKEN